MKIDLHGLHVSQKNQAKLLLLETGSGEGIDCSGSFSFQ